MSGCANCPIRSSNRWSPNAVSSAIHSLNRECWRIGGIVAIGIEAGSGVAAASRAKSSGSAGPVDADGATDGAAGDASGPESAQYGGRRLPAGIELLVLAPLREPRPDGFGAGS